MKSTLGFLVRRRLVKAALALLVLGSTLVNVQPASGIAAGNDRYNPARWAPNNVYSILSNGLNEDVAYWMRWEFPEFWIQDQDHADYGVFELGWKQTRNAGCSGSSYFSEAGFPSGVRKTVDYSEDADDAVIWIADMDTVAYSQFANLGREYFVTWRCNNSNVFSSTNVPEATFNVATNRCSSAACIPGTTLTSSNLNYVPKEQAYRGFPIGSNGQSKHTHIGNPWLYNWQFESGLSNWSWDGLSTHYCNPYTGRISSCYQFLRPTAPGQGGYNNWLRQTFDVFTYSDNQGYTAGYNTGKQFGSYFRCPTWAPSWAGIPTSYCQVFVWVYSANSPQGVGFGWNLPADGRWYSLLSDEYAAGLYPGDRYVKIDINTRGYPIDIDGTWVSSDY